MQDFFGKNADALKDKKLYLFDMDGTIYRENDLFDGIVEMLAKIKNKGGRYALSSFSVEGFILPQEEKQRNKSKK